MNKYVLICPYFGKLPNNVQLWLDSCKYNKSIDFLVFTDDKRDLNIPKNVKFYYKTIDEMRRYVQKKFQFKISLNNPYKFCDFKPAYGYIFEEYIKGYLYWGSCDMDLIFGDLISFLPKKDYAKISNLGHVTFYKNEYSINYLFLNNEDTPISYKDIFSVDANMAFDESEEYGIKRIFQLEGYEIYPFEKYVADMTTITSNLKLSHYICDENKYKIENEESIFSYENGKILGWKIDNNRIVKKEYAYLHFQKRRMVDYRHGSRNKYIIGPHGFYDYQNVDIKLFSKFHGRNIDFELIKRKLKSMKNKIARNKQIKALQRGKL